jgi:S-formylglutathione hydrolase
MERVEQHASHGGSQEVWRHTSSTTECEMKFGIYLPEVALRGQKCPVLYWLSGLTCTEQNFITKAGVQRYAAEHGIIVVAPDTSPRGSNVPDSPDYDLGQGAGFYVNATRDPWATHFRMYNYIASELPTLIEANFAASDARAISGHSMGGHGALVIALRNQDRYRSVSAFSPIVSPSQVPWGQKAFGAYLGDDREAWKQYDAVELVGAVKGQLTILVDQGGNDEFLSVQLQPQRLQVACEKAGYPLRLNVRESHDHSYYFIATFIGEHMAWHAKALA